MSTFTQISSVLAGIVRSAGFALAAAGLSTAQVPAPVTVMGPHNLATAQGTGPYSKLDNIQAPWTNLGLVPFRPMIITPDDAHLYAVNTHDSTVVHFDNASGPPTDVFRVPFGPVSIAFYDSHPDLIARLLVVSRGNHVLAILDRFTGDVLEVIPLPFEPADILVDDPSGLAYVACSGTDEVVKVDLLQAQVAAHYPIPAKHPAFLSFDTDGSVLVAPMISGNNSGLLRFQPFGALVIDLDDPILAPTGGLPDEDLFRIDPQAGTVTAVARSTGTNLFAHGVNPATGRFWQLNVQAKNKDPQKQSEPAINGDFAENRLTITTLPPPGSPIATNHTVHDLDDSDPNTPGAQFDPLRTVALPWGLSFSTNGYAMVTGLATDNVTVLNTLGNFVLEWDLPDGSLPRSAIIDPATGTIVIVYCWGTNKVELYSLAPFNGTSFATLDLGFDPTPAKIKAGRKLFYEADHSANNHLTCGHCHIEVRTDQLGWNLSGLPADNKGPKVTQTLAGIKKLPPFHWRGERPKLKDFNAAFVGLLGASSELSDDEFAEFEAFVFSLENPANPGQDPRRILNDALSPVFPNGLKGSAVRGQHKFITLASDGPLSCSNCHTLPTASDNDILAEIASHIAQQGHIEVTAFNEMWRKEQPIVPVDLKLGANLVVEPMPLLGFGLLDDGSIDSLFDFVNAFAISPQDVADIAAFCLQFDQGLGPAVHIAILLDQAHPTSSQIKSSLVLQAQRDSCSVAVFGTFPIAGVPRLLNWAYDPVQNQFLCEDSSVPPKILNDFRIEAASGLASNLFVGLPPGNAERAAIDFDLDELRNVDEGSYGTAPYDSDSDDDGALDGIEVSFGSNPLDPLSLPNDTVPPVIKNLSMEWVTSKNARLTFETSEPAGYVVDYALPASPLLQVSEDRLSKVHSVILPDLLPSTIGLPPGFDKIHTYNGTLKVTDDSGLVASVALPSFTAESFIFSTAPPFVAVIGDFGWASLVKTLPGTLQAQGTVRVDFKIAGPPSIGAPDYVVIGNLLVNGQIWANYTSTQPTSFKLFGSPYTLMPGPFVISKQSAGDGATQFDFRAQGLSLGDQVVFNPIAVVAVDPNTYNPADPDVGDATTNPLPMLNWSFPDTPKALRNLGTIF